MLRYEIDPARRLIILTGEDRHTAEGGVRLFRGDIAAALQWLLAGPENSRL